MSSIAFNLPDTRLVTHKDYVYKVKLLDANTGQATSRGTCPCDTTAFCEEMEAVIRSLIYAKNKSAPSKIQTEHFLVDCAFKAWPAPREILFEKHDRVLKAHPYMFILNVRPKTSSMRKSSEDNLNTSAYDNHKRQSKQSEVVRKRDLPDSTSCSSPHPTGSSENDDKKKPESVDAASHGQPTMRLRNHTEKRKATNINPVYSTRLSSKKTLDYHSTETEQIPVTAAKKRSNETCNSKSDTSLPPPKHARHSSLEGSVAGKVKISRKDVHVEKDHPHSTLPSKQQSTKSKPSSAGHKIAKQVRAYECDRQVIAQENLAEEMKLQKLAKSSTPPDLKKTRRRSLVERTFDTLMTPVKKLFK